MDTNHSFVGVIIMIHYNEVADKTPSADCSEPRWMKSWTKLWRISLSMTPSYCTCVEIDQGAVVAEFSMSDIKILILW
jgi:hypothetical protein